MMAQNLKQPKKAIMLHTFGDQVGQLFVLAGFVDPMRFGLAPSSMFPGVINPSTMLLHTFGASVFPKKAAAATTINYHPICVGYLHKLYTWTPQVCKTSS